MTLGTILLFNYEYYAELNNGIQAPAALSKAQTIAVTFVIMFQIFYMINCRSLNDSVFKIGFFSNKFVFYGIGAILAMQALFIYTPFFQQIFGTTSLGLRDIAISALAGFFIFPIISIEKWLLKRIFK
jgi:Ca2+-transporting ATPase